jgi:hypothetical protein
MALRKIILVAFQLSDLIFTPEIGYWSAPPTSPGVPM